MLRELKLVLYSLLILLFIFVGLSILGVKFLYDAQFGRFERPDETLTANLRYTDLAEQYARELVSFYSGKNKLQGYLYSQQGAAGLIVVAHGLGGGADSYLPQIVYFLDQGWSVFAYDATGCYDSEGKGSRGFPQAVVDLNAALTFIKTIPDLDKLPLLLFGHSWGGYAVSTVLHFEHDIAGVVAISAPSAPLEIVMEQGRRLLGSVIYTQRPFIWLYQKLLFGEFASLEATQAISDSNVPILVIHGSEDDVVSFSGSALIAKSDQITNPQVEFLVLDEPGRNGHNNLFRSKNALAYIEPLNEIYRGLFHQYGGDIPVGVRQDFYNQVDRNLAQELDQDLMGAINDFFLRCLP